MRAPVPVSSGCRRLTLIPRAAVASWCVDRRRCLKGTSIERRSNCGKQSFDAMPPTNCAAARKLIAGQTFLASPWTSSCRGSDIGQETRLASYSTDDMARHRSRVHGHLMRSENQRAASSDAVTMAKRLVARVQAT